MDFGVFLGLFGEERLRRGAGVGTRGAKEGIVRKGD